MQMSQYSKDNVCFVMFLDDQTLSKLSSEGSSPDEKGYIGLWKIVVVKNLPYEDMRRTGKVPKFLSSKFSCFLFLISMLFKNHSLVGIQFGLTARCDSTLTLC